MASYSNNGSSFVEEQAEKFLDYRSKNQVRDFDLDFAYWADSKDLPEHQKVEIKELVERLNFHE